MNDNHPPDIAGAAEPVKKNRSLSTTGWITTVIVLLLLFSLVSGQLGYMMLSIPAAMAAITLATELVRRLIATLSTSADKLAPPDPPSTTHRRDDEPQPILPGRDPGIRP